MVETRRMKAAAAQSESAAPAPAAAEKEPEKPKEEEIEPADLGELFLWLVKWLVILVTTWWYLRKWLWLPYLKAPVQKYNHELICTCLIPFLFAKTLHGQGFLLFSAFFVALNDGSLEK